MQIDVLKIYVNVDNVECNMYTNDRCVKIYMTIATYMQLVQDGYFIRHKGENISSHTKDSADVINTTNCYYEWKEVKQ